MNRTKLVVASVLALLVIVIVLQNTEPVETKVLFLTFTLPRAFLLFGTFIAGFLVGILWTARFASES